MNPAILRKVLTYAAPFIIGYVVKKFEDRQKRKEEEKAVARSYQNLKNRIGQS